MHVWTQNCVGVAVEDHPPCVPEPFGEVDYAAPVDAWYTGPSNGAAVKP